MPDALSLGWCLDLTCSELTPASLFVVLAPKGSSPNCVKGEWFSEQLQPDGDMRTSRVLPSSSSTKPQAGWGQPLPCTFGVLQMLYALWSCKANEHYRSLSRESGLGGNPPKEKPDLFVGITQSWIIHWKCVSKSLVFFLSRSSVAWRSRGKCFLLCKHF